ncbi:MAG: Calx-beta domain-containing protein [Actinomycetota bacterium]
MGTMPGSEPTPRARTAALLLTAVLVAGVWPMATYSGPASAGIPTCADQRIDASDGAGALEAAVVAANACIGHQTIEIDGGTFETDGLSITDPLTIVGVDSAARPELVSKGSSGSVINATAGVDVAVSNLAVTTTGNWSFLNQRGGTVALDHVDVALTDTPGCGVSSGSAALVGGSGVFELVSSSIVGAACSGVSVFGTSTIDIVGSRIADSGNHGIDASGSTVTIDSSEIVGNGQSGVRSANPSSTLAVNASSLADNGAHGVDWASGNVVIGDSFVGALPDGVGGFVPAGNTGDGIRANFADLDLDNTVVAHNDRGVYLGTGPTGQHAIDDSEIRDNAGAGVYANGGVAAVADTVITGNTPNCEEVVGQIADGGGSVDDDGSCGFASLDTPTIFVNTTAEGGDVLVGDGVCDIGGETSPGVPACSLRAAIEEANFRPDLDVLSLVDGVYTEAATITENLALVGTSIEATAIEPVLVVEELDRFAAQMLTMSGVTSSGGTSVQRTDLNKVAIVPRDGSTSLLVRTPLLRMERTTIEPPAVGTATRIATVDRLEVLKSGLDSVTIGGIDSAQIERSSFVGASSFSAEGPTTIAESLFDVGDAVGVTAVPGPVTVSNSTFAGLRPLFVSAGGRADVSFSTMTGDNYAVFAQPGGTLNIEASALTAADTAPACAGDIASIVTSIADDASCGVPVAADLGLGALGDNGGPTSTFLPESGSVLIDAAGGVACPVVDQRGEPRPIDGDADRVAVCDIGAVEAPQVTVERELTVLVDVVAIASENIRFGVEVDVLGATSVVPTEPLAVEPGWPLAEPQGCAGDLSDWFEFRRPTCSGIYTIAAPDGAVVELSAVGAGDDFRPFFGGDCTTSSLANEYERVASIADVPSPTCTITLVQLGNEPAPDDVAAVHLTQRWVGDPSGAPDPAIRVEPAGDPSAGVDASADSPIPQRQCREPDEFESSIDVFLECVDAVTPCPTSDLGCQTFVGVDVGTLGGDLVVEVEDVDGWLTALSGDCSAAGVIADVRNEDVVRCDLVHVQTAASGALVVEWNIDTDADLYGPLGPRRTIDVQLDVQQSGEQIDQLIPDSKSALPPQDQPLFNCAAPSFPTTVVPATCRSIVGLDPGSYDVSLIEQHGVRYTTTLGPVCGTGSIVVPIDDAVICQADIAPQAPAFRVDPIPRAVLEGTGDTPTRIPFDLTFDTPTPPGYRLETVPLVDGQYNVDTAGDMLQPRIAEVVGASGFETLPAGTTEHTVWIDIDADNDPEPLTAGFIAEITEDDTGRRVRIHVTVTDDDEATSVTADDDRGPAPFRTELRFDPGANSPESYEWTVSPSGDVFTTDEPTLDITLVDVGTHTIAVVGILPGGAPTAESSVDIEVEPTTLSIAPTEAREGDTWEPTPGRPFDVVGLLDREVTLDVVVTPGADAPTTEAATVGTSCTDTADVALVDTDVRVGSGTVTIPIVPCRDDDPERDSAFTVELVEPTTNTVITSAEMALLDDDRYVITPFELREGGLAGDAFESVPVSRELPINSPPWYSPAPARYTLLGVGSIPPQCSVGDFLLGAEVGLSFAPPLALSSTVVPSGAATVPTVVVCGNASEDGTREFTVEVEAPDGSIDRGTFTVLDDDAPAQFNTTSIVIDEPVDSGAIPVEIGIEPEPYERQLAVAWAPASGGAAPGACVPTQPFDFVPSANPLVTVAANATSFLAPVLVCGDTPTDPDGALNLLISRPPTSVEEVLNPTVLKVIPATILDASALRITVTDVSIVEGDDGTKIAEVDILAAGIGAASASFTTAQGGVGATAAQAGKDYISVDGDLVAALAPWSKTVEIPIIGDVIDEDDEVFRLIVTSADATVVDGHAQIVITDNDVATAEVADVSVVEGGTARVPIELTNPSERPLTVRWETRDGSATSPADYAVGTGVLDFPPGATRRTVAIPVNADDLAEGDEEFAVFAAVEGSSPAGDLGEVTIIDDAPPVIVGAGDVLVDVPSGTQRPTAVTFDVVAEDEIDGRLPVACNPASGSGFALGTTEVECTATDSVGGTGTATFDVVVGVFNGIVVGPEPFADLVAGIPTQPIRGGVPIQFVGPGFDPNQRVQVILRSDPVALGTFSADGDGTVDAVVTIPPGTPAGEHTLAMEAIDGDRRILVTIEVSADVADSPGTADPPSAAPAPVVADPVVPPGGLPSTGGNAGGLLVGGALVALLGGVLWLFGRRRGRWSGVRHQT